MSTHTPIPWTVTIVPDGFSNGPAVLISTLRRDVARLVLHEQAEANAELICRAVNEHAQLVAALEVMIAYAAQEICVPVEECTGGPIGLARKVLDAAKGQP